MVSRGSRRSLREVRMPLDPMAIAFFLVILTTTSSASFDNITFNFQSFDPNMQRIEFDGNATVTKPFIQLTTNQRDKDMNYSAGWATYFEPMHLWDKSTGKIADFSTRFSFIIDSLNDVPYADGFTFFLVPNGTQMHLSSEGGYLALPFTNSTSPNTSRVAFMAVEFDTFCNTWYPGYVESMPNKAHIGIDVNSVVSVVTEPWEWKKVMSGKQAEAWFMYDSSAGNLSVLLVDESDPNYLEKENKNISSLSYQVNLSEFLPEWVTFGFSGSTGYNFELHKIISWEFYSSLQIAQVAAPVPSPSSRVIVRKKKSKAWLWIIISCAGAIVLFITIAVIARFRRSPKEEVKRASGEEDGNAALIDEELEKMAGPWKFSYNELAMATDDFAAGRLLGEGGFGKAYGGCLSGLDNKVAIKKITADSEQELQEYAAELKAVSQLRHRSLVQLFGWCYKDQELLLVYEFMSNGSLDSHLFKHKTLLTWEERYRIAQDLASAILYLHEEWAKCVVRRDIKCSNIMLDSSLNAKLGDFGLARFVDHGKGSQTTMLAGTLGYLAPECVYQYRASKESDVYSFRIVALEIACGRRVFARSAEEGQVHLVYWVWELYGAGKLLDAADPMLEDQYNTREMEIMMMVGLWCVQPDHTLRPSIREALNVLKFNGSLPVLPSKMPVLAYTNPFNTSQLSLVSSHSTSSNDRISSTTKSSTFKSSSKDARRNMRVSSRVEHGFSGHADDAGNGTSQTTQRLTFFM